MAETKTKQDGEFFRPVFLSQPNSTFRPEQRDPRSLYIHIPFCRHRCGYCNFTLVAGRDYLIERFLNALETEINWLDRRYRLDTVFLGGGTPSHLSPAQIDRLGEILHQRFDFDAQTEVTAECNPNDVNVERMGALCRLGVNRISLGVQSLNPDKLKKLERDHNLADIRTAVSISKSNGCSVSIDLIFAAPDETLDEWRVDLDTALSLEPEHISTYELTYEKGTQFWNRLTHGDVSISDEDLRAEMYQLAIEKIELAGLSQYEVSSFASNEQQCQHNKAYWMGLPYFAFGPGAARYVDGIRETNHQSTMKYLKQVEAGESPVSDREQLAPLAAARERLAIGLRMIEGIDETEFQNTTQFPPRELLGKLAADLENNGMLAHERGRLKLTRNGLMIADWIAAKIVG